MFGFTRGKKYPDILTSYKRDLPRGYRLGYIISSDLYIVGSDEWYVGTRGKCSKQGLNRAEVLTITLQTID